MNRDQRYNASSKGKARTSRYHKSRKGRRALKRAQAAYQDRCAKKAAAGGPVDCYVTTLNSVKIVE
jgi:hypothetical protein